MLRRRGQDGPIAIECNWKAGSLDPAALLAFRRIYPADESFVVAADVERSYTRTCSGLQIAFVFLEDLVTRLAAEPLAGADRQHMILLARAVGRASAG